MIQPHNYCCALLSTLQSYITPIRIMAGGRPKGRVDNPYNKRKPRDETEEEKNARIKKTNDTKKRNKSAAALAAAKAFFQPRMIAGSSAPIINHKEFKDEEEAEDEENIITVMHSVATITPAIDVVANLDIVHHTEEQNMDDDDEESQQDDAYLGVQQEYVKAIQLRIKEEVNQNANTANQWVLEHLKGNGWWIRKENSHQFAKRLGLKKSYDAYYRDVYIWLPDVRWENCMPCCPSCRSNEHVVNHGFRENHFGRVIVGMKEMYYIISRCYRCYSCMKKAKRQN